MRLTTRLRRIGEREGMKQSQTLEEAWREFTRGLADAFSPRCWSTCSMRWGCGDEAIMVSSYRWPLLGVWLWNVWNVAVPTLPAWTVPSVSISITFDIAKVLLHPHPSI